MKHVAFFFLELYKKLLSPLWPNICRFTPTCSAYTYQAIDKYGVFRGSFMGMWRILRCNPWSKGGYNPVKENLRGNMKWLI